MTRSLKACLYLLLLFVLAGCPFMMPAMMGPMMGKDAGKSGDAKVEAVVQGLIQEGVAALADNRGSYDSLFVARTTVKGQFIQEGRFRSLLLKALRSENEWQQVLDEEMPAQGETEHFRDRSESPSVHVNAEIYQEKDLFYLSLEMRDSRTRLVLWKETFSKPWLESPHVSK